MMPLRRTQFWDELTDISKHAGFEKDFSGLLLKARPQLARWHLLIQLWWKLGMSYDRQHKKILRYPPTLPLHQLPSVQHPSYSAAIISPCSYINKDIINQYLPNNWSICPLSQIGCWLRSKCNQIWTLCEGNKVGPLNGRKQMHLSTSPLIWMEIKSKVSAWLQLSERSSQILYVGTSYCQCKNLFRYSNYYAPLCTFR